MIAASVKPWVVNVFHIPFQNTPLPGALDLYFTFLVILPDAGAISTSAEFLFLPASLLVLLPLVSVKNVAGWLACWERASHSALRVCCRKMFCCVICIFCPTWCLCWDLKFNCIDSWSLYSYF